MTMEEPKNQSERGAEIRKALCLFEEIDGHRNLHRSMAIIIFAVSGGISIQVFFFVSDLSLWGDVSHFIAVGITSLTWVMLFPIWIIFFLSIMCLLNAFKIVDLQGVARGRLSNMTLGSDALGELGDMVASQNFHHGPLYERVISDLSKKLPD